MEGASNRFPDLGIRDISQSEIAWNGKKSELYLQCQCYTVIPFMVTTDFLSSESTFKIHLKLLCVN